MNNYYPACACAAGVKCLHVYVHVDKSTLVALKGWFNILQANDSIEKLRGRFLH